MIIIHDKPGQMCNRIWASASFVAQCLEKKNRLIVLNFGEYSDSFLNINAFDSIWFVSHYGESYNKKCRFLFKLLKNIPNLLLRIFNVYIDKKKWGKENWPVDVLESRYNIVFLGSWYHPKDNRYLLSHKNEINTIFKPAERYTSNVNGIINVRRQKADVIVGVHMRRKDYKYWRKGEYYYKDNVYINYMRQILKDLPGCSVSFLLCSDDVIDEKNFSDLNFFTISNSSSIEDLYALSLCDYIVGPPSTFSMWSSFYGEVPLRFIVHENENIYINEFSKIVCMNVFENGSRFTH